MRPHRREPVRATSSRRQAATSVVEVVMVMVPLEPARQHDFYANVADAIAGKAPLAFTPEVGPRRAGDPPRIVASGALAARDLGWAMRHSLAEKVESAWSARRKPSS